MSAFSPALLPWSFTSKPVNHLHVGAPLTGANELFGSGTPYNLSENLCGLSEGLMVKK